MWTASTASPLVYPDASIIALLLLAEGVSTELSEHAPTGGPQFSPRTPDAVGIRQESPRQLRMPTATYR